MSRNSEQGEGTRTDESLAELVEELWRGHFSDVPRVNRIEARFTRTWKSRVALIRYYHEENFSLILVNGLLRFPEAPGFMPKIAAAHELCHYAHGFGSSIKPRYEHPHAGGVVDRELHNRALGRELNMFNRWLDDWDKFYEKMMRRF